MDGTTFDAIVKRLSSDTDRRRLLAGLVGGGLSGLIGRDTEAKRKTAGQKEKEAQDRATEGFAPQVVGEQEASGLKCRRRPTDRVGHDHPGLQHRLSHCGGSRGIRGRRGLPSDLPTQPQSRLLLMALIEQKLIEAGQVLQILQRFFAEGIIAALEFRRLVERFVRDGIIALCGGDLRRLCISNSGELACCNRGEPCTNGTCQCPPNQVRCGNACMERCPSNEVRDPNRNCQCVCSSGLRRCGGRCLRCPRGQSLDLETCECRCGQGYERCGEDCVPSCPTGLAYDAETCECLCPAGATGCCGSDEECRDSNVCTQDRCDFATNRCVNQPADGCCRQDGECTTANPCTRDTCNQATNTCNHAQIAECCRNDGECGACERCSDQNTCVADRAKDTTSCIAGDATGACCNGTCKVCADGQTLDTDTCGCAGGGGDSCVCAKADLGERCERGIDCCSGACGDPFEDQLGYYCHDLYNESFCADGGAFCANDADGSNHCCSGVCTNCVCEDFICREAGDPDCRFDANCCGAAVCLSRRVLPRSRREVLPQ